ncbi:hypothetical protein QW131_19210 [Roseibium salinum]|nr:hypothetical protein [Roseibium salinum]
MFAGAVHAADFRVTFINPGGESGFWGEVSKTMAAAAADLDVELEILYADRQLYRMEALLQQRLDQGDLPDYFILVNEKSGGRAAASTARRQAQQDLLFLLNKLTAKQMMMLERRNITMDNIVASIIPDNEIAGYDMAQSLFLTVHGSSIRTTRRYDCLR